jgi:predicted nucleic acid-binding protein
MIFLDSNILVYASNTDCDFYNKASEVVDKTLSGEIRGCISFQVLNEFYAVITDRTKVENPLNAETAVETIQTYIESDDISKLQFDARSFDILCDLAKSHQVITQKIYDLRIVATMIANDVQDIYTGNSRDFIRFDDINVINPFSEADNEIRNSSIDFQSSLIPPEEHS